MGGPMGIWGGYGVMGVLWGYGGPMGGPMGLWGSCRGSCRVMGGIWGSYGVMGVLWGVL